MRVGFPHSEIPGSKPVCRLPETYRRLLRPSSPVIAKASTTCTCSLDPITLAPRTFIRRMSYRRTRVCPRPAPFARRTRRYNLTLFWIRHAAGIIIEKRVFNESGLASKPDLYFFRIVKERYSQMNSSCEESINKPAA